MENGGGSCGEEGVEGVGEFSFDDGPGVGGDDEAAAVFAEGAAGVGVVEEVGELGLEVGVVAEPEAGVGGTALGDEYAGFGVDEGRGAREEGFEEDDAERFVDGGVDEGEGAGHGFVFFLFGDESGVGDGGPEVGGGVNLAGAGEDEADVAAGAAAEGVHVVADERGALEGFAAAGVEDVGGGDVVAGGEGGGRCL